MNARTLLPLTGLLTALFTLSACTPEPTTSTTAAQPASTAVAATEAPVAITEYTHFRGIGRNATVNEVAAWDIDVRPDFQGLPPGSGSAEEGEEIWIDKCASCHGDFGDANHVFFPLIGNTTEADIESGQVAALQDPGKVRTTIMKVPYVSTLWDFVYRAMPWNAPKTLTVDETYALVAYMLNLAEVIEYEEPLTEANIAEYQARMPNRNGITFDHGMWSVDGEPDTHNTACMSDCTATVEISSELPEFAYDAHGDLIPQFRRFGPVRGWDLGLGDDTAATNTGTDVPTEILSANGCLACHAMDRTLIGPSLDEIAQRYAAKDREYLTNKIYEGGSGVWGSMPMPPQPNLSDTDAAAITAWLTQ